VLDHHYAVESLRNRCTGHDLKDLAGLRNWSRPNLAAAQLADDAKRMGGVEIRGPASESVACGARKGRLIAIGGDWLSQNAVQAVQQGD
jgi:hypothetical protein